MDTDYGMLRFEGGIDWWLPQRGRITIELDYGSLENVERQWYVNGNGVKLSFGAQKYFSLPPGLCIPDSEWVVDMREAEAEASIDYDAIDAEIDYSVLEKLREHVKKRVGKRLPQFIRKPFQGYILSPQYESDGNKIHAIGLEKFDLRTIRGINKLEGVVEETLRSSEK